MSVPGPAGSYSLGTQTPLLSLESSVLVTGSPAFPTLASAPSFLKVYEGTPMAPLFSAVFSPHTHTHRTFFTPRENTAILWTHDSDQRNVQNVDPYHMNW